MMKKKNLLLLSHNLDLGGAPFFLLNLAKGFLLKNYEVHLVSPQDGPLKDEFENNGIRVSVFDFNKNSGVKDIIRYCDTNHIDLIFFNTILMHGLIIDLKKLEIPFVWAIHESEIDHYEEILKFKKESFSRCNKIIFAAEETKKLYLEYLDGEDHVKIIPNGIDWQAIKIFKQKYSQSSLRKKYGHTKSDTIVVSVGTVCERKGQYEFVQAALYLLRSDLIDKKHTFFYVVGYKEIYDYGQQLKKMIKSFGCEDNIRLIGETKGIFDYYHIPDIFVCTSYIESFPLVILEAMAFEKAIISTDVYGIKEQIEDKKDGLLFSPGMFTELKDGLLRLIKDGRLRKKIASGAFSKAKQKFQMSTMQENYEDLFLSLF